MKSQQFSFRLVFSFLICISAVIAAFTFFSCSTFTYKTYPDSEAIEDPEPVYEITLNPDFQHFTNFMFIGNRIENFGTYFNTFYNANEDFEEAYNDYSVKVLSHYSEKIDNIYSGSQLSQESIDRFNKAIEKASRVIQYHKSSAYMDKAVLLIGKCYFYLGDYLKAERKFGEFISKLSVSPLLDETRLYLAKTQFRLNQPEPALKTIDNLITNSKDGVIISGAYQTIAEYYLSKKNYAEAVSNYKKSIEFSNDKEFQAQMQYLIANITAMNDYKIAANEFDKVLNYDSNYDLEYYALFNQTKYLILSGEFNKAKSLLNHLKLKYKEDTQHLPEIMLLDAVYYDQKKDYDKALRKFYYVLSTYPRSVSSSEASYHLANYFENIKGDYLKAFQYYRYSNEESSNNRYTSQVNSKIKTFKRYFELRSVIEGKTIKTDYDSAFYKKTNKEDKEEKILKEKGEDGGSPGYFQDTTITKDTTITQTIDSTRIKAEKIASAKYEIAELFSYLLNRNDSAEYYFKSAFEESYEYDLKSKSLFALAILYRNNNENAKSEQLLKTVIDEFPESKFAGIARTLLNMPEIEKPIDAADSIYLLAEKYFIAGDYSNSLIFFEQVFREYPSSDYNERSAYAAGWIYENILNNNDTAYFYYSKVIELNPESEYAKNISQKVQEYNLKLNDTLTVSDTTMISDTLKTNEEINKEQPNINEETKTDEEIRIDDDGNIIKEEEIDIKPKEK